MVSPARLTASLTVKLGNPRFLNILIKTDLLFISPRVSRVPRLVQSTLIPLFVTFQSTLLVGVSRRRIIVKGVFRVSLQKVIPFRF